MNNPYLMPTKRKGQKLVKTGWNYYLPLKQALTELAESETVRLERKISVPTIIRTLTTVNDDETVSLRAKLAKRIKQIEKEMKHEAKKQ